MKKITAGLLALATAASPCLASAAAPLSTVERLRQKFNGSARSLNQIFENSDKDGALDNVIADVLPSPDGRNQDDLRKMMLLQLDGIKLGFMTKYAPGILKRKTFGWDLEAEIAKAQKVVQDNPNITLAQYHDVLRAFFNSMKDYHVSVRFNATKASSLPFKVVGAQGRYFIAYINDGADLPFQVGDEIISFGGRRIADVVKELKALLGGNKDATDETLATMVLTSRRDASFGRVEGGKDDNAGVMVAVMPKGGTRRIAMEIPWELVDEDYPDARPREAARHAYPGPYKMLSPVRDLAPDDNSVANPFGLGDHDGFLPPLGSEIVWMSPAPFFKAYIYKLPDGRPIGCVRISSYDFDSDDDYVKAAAEFGDLMNRFNRSTAGLVIDQLHNPGGAIFYMYALASMLTRGNDEEDWLATPQHRVAITDEDVKTAKAFIKSGANVHDTEDAQKAMGGETAAGYPVDMQLFKFMLEYSKMLVAQAEQRKTLTDTLPLEGVHKIRPSAVAHYSKPILLLVDEMDFSGGDFFPSILQDNRRALVFGTNTAGAGGFVNTVNAGGVLGVDNYTMTGSFALRSDKTTSEEGTPLENLGVTPDPGHKYDLTSFDVQNNFKNYVEKVNEAIAGMAETSSDSVDSAWRKLGL